MAGSLIVASKVKEALKAYGLRSDGSLPEALNAKVNQILREAAQRAKANNRSTVRPHDL